MIMKTFTCNERSVLRRLAEAKALVPQLWYLEVMNVILAVEKHKTLKSNQVEDFILQLAKLSNCGWLPDHTTSVPQNVFLARNYKLSRYDAAYLELAMHMGLPMATLDKDLKEAAEQARVKLYLV